MKTFLVAGALGLACALCALPAGAGVSLLDPATQSQLERWLGAGRLRLDPLFIRDPGEDARDFHAAADARGPTFVLMALTNRAGDNFVVGGYNPQSWSSTDGWHNTPYDSERTAFLFNLSAPAVYRQVLSDYILPSQGLRQTFNARETGPTFGTGHDLFVDTTLHSAFSWQLSYGDPAQAGASIVDRSTGGQIVQVDALEVFAVSAVPEPAVYAMLLGGLALLSLGARTLRS